MPRTITGTTDNPLKKALLRVDFGPFEDETETVSTPKSATWTLTDAAGNVVNGRNDVSITPASTITVLLSGDDLAVPAGDDGRRALLLEWIYDSSLGSDLPGKEVVYFTITPLGGVS